MPRICCREQNFGVSALDIIQKANQIISEYMAKGFKLTLRQLYYQFVSRDWIPNQQKSYKRLGSIINDARLAGAIDWNAIEDRGRNLSSLATWESPKEIISACASQFRIDLWQGQEFRPEVWVEKEALAGVVGAVCNRLRVDYFACKGYVSQSEMWDAGRNRLSGYINDGQKPIIIHLGDHDPSGMDMTRDIRERLSMFAGGRVEVSRIALNFEQIEQYKPPPNPAKTTDSRFTEYEAQYGDESWELDALNPDILDSLVSEAVLSVRDEDTWGRNVAEENKQKDQLKLVSNKWEKIVAEKW